MKIAFDNTYYLTESRAHDQPDLFAPNDRWGWLGTQSRFVNRVAEWNRCEALRNAKRIQRWADGCAKRNPSESFRVTFRNTIQTTQCFPTAIESRTRELRGLGVNADQIERV